MMSLSRQFVGQIILVNLQNLQIKINILNVHHHEVFLFDLLSFDAD